ncbi:MAG: nucleotide sugar dehydrogenase, partial [Paracoccaceae bacterium]
MPNLISETLVTKITDKTACIGVIGLGYVGLPLSLAIVQNGLQVLGFDVDDRKPAQIAAGQSYLKHIPSAVIADSYATGRLHATNDFSRLSEPDVLVICVPTPLNSHHEPDLSYLVETAQDIAKTLRKGQLVVLESTTYPGTTDDVVRPILEATGLVSGQDFLLAFSPEREDPGNASFSTTSIPKVMGADDDGARAAAKAFYESVIDVVVPVSSTRAAEATKLTENIFRAVNIALVNELKTIYEPMGVDVWEVIDAAKTKPFGFMPFYPGPGLGGHCIPIDPFYLTWKAKEFDVRTRFIELAGEINSAMPSRVVDKLALA